MADRVIVNIVNFRLGRQYFLKSTILLAPRQPLNPRNQPTLSIHIPS